MPRPGGFPHQSNRHPAEVTADRLRHDVDRWADKFDGRERDMIGELIHALEEIAEGKR